MRQSHDGKCQVLVGQCGYDTAIANEQVIQVVHLEIFVDHTFLW